MTRNNKIQIENSKELDEMSKRLISRIRQEDEVDATEVEASFDEVMRKVDDTGRRVIYRRLYRTVVSVAAVVALLLGGTWWIMNNWPAEDAGSLDLALLEKETLPAAHENIILDVGEQNFRLDDDVSLHYDKTGGLVAGRLELENDPHNRTHEVVNRILVPYGKRTDVVLSDGTHIYINAGSKLVYPRTFEKGVREVLLEGEAYFDVARNEKCPFIVKTNGMDVQVLGTSFNVRAYCDEDSTAVVLAKGSVEVGAGKRDGKIRLAPNEMLVCTAGTTSVQTVDVAEYVGWKDDMLVVNGKLVGTVLRQLERYYNCSIKTDERTAGRLLSGKLNLHADVRNVMESICLLLDVRYEYKGEKEFILKSNEN